MEPQIVFGGVDTEVADYGVMDWYPVGNQSLPFWNLQLDNVSIGGTMLPRVAHTVGFALFDPFMHFPQGKSLFYSLMVEEYNAIFGALMDSGKNCSITEEGYIYCEVLRRDYSAFPQLRFDFGANTSYVIEPRDYVYFVL